MSYSVSPIGYVHSCFKEKFAIPRQPHLAPAARGVIELVTPFNNDHALEGLEHVSHIWVLFVFHQALEDKPRLRVRPPRLGGNQSIGVFASRATHRPNGIGQSVLRLDHFRAGRLHVSGLDLLDQTPILDIKPYVPYADALPLATNTLAGEAPQPLTVSWQDSARLQALEHGNRLSEPLAELIEQCLAQDPKPAYQHPTPERIYGVKLWDVEVKWHYPTPCSLQVLSVTKA